LGQDLKLKKNVLDMFRKDLRAALREYINDKKGTNVQMEKGLEEGDD
jgi:hypothetical protein